MRVRDHERLGLDADQTVVQPGRLSRPAELVLLYIATVINERQTDRVDDFIAPGYRGHGFHADREALRSFLTWQAETAPEWVIDVQDVVAERDRVAVRAVASGTRAERAPGEPYDTPSFQRVEWITIYRIESDLISEAWVVSRTLDVP